MEAASLKDKGCTGFQFDNSLCRLQAVATPTADSTATAAVAANGCYVRKAAKNMVPTLTAWKAYADLLNVAGDYAVKKAAWTAAYTTQNWATYEAKGKAERARVDTVGAWTQ